MDWSTTVGGVVVGASWICFLMCNLQVCGLGGSLGEELIEMRGDVRVSANMASPFVRVTSLYSHPIHLQPTPQDHASPSD